MSDKPAPSSDLDADLIVRSLTLAAERAGDITPQVYEALFARHPEMEALFVRDTTGAVRGEMLARVIEIILDFIETRAFSDHMIQCEVVTHEGYGVPRDVFGDFFEALAGTLCKILGDDWTRSMDKSWQTLLLGLAYFAAHPDQSATSST